MMGNPDILKAGIAALGRRELKKYLNGKELRAYEATRAKCYECMLGYADGAGDCGVPKCPLYQHMPYRREPVVFPDPAYQEQGITAQGMQGLSDHMRGKRLSHREAILARCYDCMGGYVDGKCRCNIPRCPLHPWMPYRDIICPHEKKDDPPSPPPSP